MTRKQKRPWGVFAAIILAIFFGSFIGESGVKWGIPFYSILDLAGTLFLNALTLVVVPLVSSSIIAGIARIGCEGGFGRIGGKTFFFYLSTSIVAILIGLFFVNLIGPGSGHIVPTEVAGTVENLKQAMVNREGKALSGVLLSIVPSNVLFAFSQGNMLGLIFFSILFGYCISKIHSHHASTLQSFFQGVFETMIQVTHLIMKLLPYGVFCLVAKVFMSTGLHSLTAVSLFTLTVLLGLAVFMFIALPLLLKFVGKVRPSRQLKAMSPALITPFSPCNQW